MGRASVVLDDEIVERCQKATGIKTRRALLDHALRELLRHKRQKKILDLRGAIRWEGDLAVWRSAIRKDHHGPQSVSGVGHADA